MVLILFSNKCHPFPFPATESLLLTMSCSNRALDDRGLSFDSRDELFNKVALNIIWQMSAGERYDYADEKMKRSGIWDVDISRIKKDLKKSFAGSSTSSTASPSLAST